MTKQIPRIGAKFSSILDEAGYENFDKLRSARATDIEYYCNRNPPFGDEILRFVKKVPKYEIRVNQSSINSADLFKADLTVSIELKNYGDQPEGSTWLIVGDEENRVLLTKKLLVEIFDCSDHTFEFEYQVYKVKNGLITFDLINELVIGSDCSLKFTPKY